MKSTCLFATFIAAAMAFAGTSANAQIDALKGLGGDAAASPVSATMIADTTAVQPGATFTVGILFKIQPKWHIYWKNPGASGYATTVKWGLPAGTAGGETIYPAPESFMSPGDIISYGYENQALLMTTAKAGKVEGGQVRFTAKANWLMCSDRCVPGKKELELTLPVGDGKPANAEIFNRFKSIVPQNASTLPKGVTASAAVAGNKTTFQMTLTAPAGAKIVAEDRAPALHKAFFFPDDVKGFVLDGLKVTGTAGTVGSTKIYDSPVSITYTAASDSPAAAPTRILAGTLIMQTIAADGKPQPSVIINLNQKL